MNLIKYNKRFPVWPSILDDDFFNWPELSDSTQMDVYETEDAVVVEAAVPGVPEDMVEVTVDDNVLTIAATFEETEEEKQKKKTIYKSSRQTSFNYSTSLPRNVNSAEAVAEVENGLVRITVPKAKEALPKKIEVTKKK